MTQPWFGMVRNWVSYPWRIDRVSKRLKQATMIHSPSFPGAGRRWQLSLVARTADGFQLDDLPLYITVIDPTSLMVIAVVEASVLVGDGWSPFSEKQVVIDVNENKMGTVLVDENFLSRRDMHGYVNSDDNTITIRCRIHVSDEELGAVIPHPSPIPPTPMQEPDIHQRTDDGVDDGDSRRRSRKTRLDHSTTTSSPAKRRRLNNSE